jgi:small subunit ribosomal protein S19e
MGKSVNIKDVDPQKFVAAYASHLKKEGKLVQPKWVDIVKTGTHKQLSPNSPDWFYIRCAAIARNVYLRPGTGVGALRTRYGGPKALGVRPVHHARGAESVQRKALQALEAIGVVAKDVKGGGRRITKTGQKDLDRIAATLFTK